MKNQFNEEYYKSINYVDYLDRYNKYKKFAKEIAGLLESLSLMGPSSLILDFGCAVGFLSRAMREIGYICNGYDISDWAKQEARKNNVVLVEDPRMEWDIVFALDVLEHMTDEEIIDDLSNIDTKVLIARIPVSTDGQQFHLEVSRRDPTHINCKTAGAWKKFLEGFGYSVILPLNLYTIYTSPGVYSVLCIKN